MAIDAETFDSSFPAADAALESRFERDRSGTVEAGVGTFVGHGGEINGEREWQSCCGGAWRP